MNNRPRQLAALAVSLAALAGPFALGAAAGPGSGGGTTPGPTIPTSISVDDASSIEGNCSSLCHSSVVKYVKFTVRRTGSNLVPATVNYATVSGSAVAGSDFIAAPIGASLSFAQGQTTAVVSVRVLGNTVEEPWYESFTLKLTSATQPIADGTALGVIWDDDIPW